ncbi:hypothetical protein COCCU_01075 [Corynebacterium occultum]|uniref:Or membrane protein n=1 Tax=Corynebacterium occultum TaxID=2675219 RepID=A0A6B8VQ06_9CORY|nr:hypothetical protein [Corynebacterium occultum]QGU06183.1 hypothetical protein COCCU_01075 [Corynebacterium occultum]
MKIRNAAVAAAAALALTFSGTAVAGAEEAQPAPAAGSSIAGSSDLFDSVDADDRVTGGDLLGESRSDETNPEWAMIWRDATEIIGITAVVGGMIAFANYLQFLAANR